MKTLNALLSGVTEVYRGGNLSNFDRKIRGITGDSRKIEQGTVFVALEGSDQDGHRFVKDACARGCAAVIVEKDVDVPAQVAVVRVKDSHRAYGQMAAAFYGHPARSMTVIGLTGTNGKTTTSWIIEKMLRSDGRKTGVIGTVNYRYTGPAGQDIVTDAPLTTPEPVVLQELLREMADSGVTHVAIEVSSHALAQQRLAGLAFDAAVFTNLSRDHLDYHHTMDEYFDSKCLLFQKLLKSDGLAVVVMDKSVEKEKNQQVDWSRKLVKLLQENGFSPYNGKRKNRSYITCGFDRNCVVSAGDFVQGLHGFDCRISMGGQVVNLESQLIGRHNVLNILAAAGVGLGLGMKIDAVSQGLGAVDRIPGRLERVALPPYGAGQKGPSVFVDYAHTPDALENVLLTLQQVTRDRLICIFGCGGNRDRGKRPLMGQVAGRLADKILVTSDNPRQEDPVGILQEIEQGLCGLMIKKTDMNSLLDTKKISTEYAIHEDRKQAIHSVCSHAEASDVVLIAGKGHETYQLTMQGKRFFDDRLEAQNGRLRWTLKHLLNAASGTLEQQGDEGVFGEIATDTRTLQPGDVFLALEGENFNGHDFVGEAVRKGVAAIIASQPCPAAGPQVSVIRVDDTLKALGDLAHYLRQALASKVQVIGITGSSGKTTVKEMTAAIFEEQYNNSERAAVLKTQGNLNNLIGLPLSLLNLRAEHEKAVMEMGMNRPGEIQRLTEIADPDIGCITNVQDAHLEGLGSIDGVARAKGELFTGMADRGIRVVNYDDRHIRSLGGYHGNTVIGFAVTPAGRRYRPAVKATRIVNRGESGMRFTLHINDWHKRITVPATGEHNVANCTAASAIATAAGIGPEVIVRGLIRYQAGDKRLQITDLPGGIRVLNDSYNANPASMAAALQTVSGFGGDCRRVAALGDMLELGDAAALCHRKIGTLVAELGFDFLVVTGEFAEEVTAAAGKAGLDKDRIKVCDSTDNIARWVAGLVERKKVGQGDWLLVKGSRGMRMERVLESLIERLKKEDKGYAV